MSEPKSGGHLPQGSSGLFKEITGLLTGKAKHPGAGRLFSQTRGIFNLDRDVTDNYLFLVFPFFFLYIQIFRCVFI